ncbi:MAG: zinc-binding alcohol dehydrogenase family protein [Acidimicrobiales bacterium]|jgi:NADPH2:quinone reductase
MKAAVYYENGAPSVFRYEEVPDPVPGPGEMLVSVEVVSIEGGDTLNRLGGPLVTVPHVVGYQSAGTVLSVDPDVAGFAVGDRVVGIGFHGSHAELRVAHPLTTWKIPDGLATELAACVPVAYGTAHDGLFEFGRLGEGETALIHAGASGVGLAAIQMAHHAGARVIATASSDERLERLREFGLDDGINYREKDFVVEVRTLTNLKGADVILDSVGGENLQRSLAALAYRGRCVSFGNAGRGGPTKLDTSTLGVSNQSLIGYFLGAELFVGTRAYAMVAKLLEDVAAGDLRVEIDRRFALADAEEAHAFIESRQAFGRVVLLTE